MSDKKYEEWKKDPQTGEVNDKSVSEAGSMKKSLVQGTAYLFLSVKFRLIKYDVPGILSRNSLKTPLDPKYRSISQQSSDIANKINIYDKNTKVLVDLKNLSGGDKMNFVEQLTNKISPDKINSVNT